MHAHDEKVAEVLAPAKINLCLLVGPRGEDGYHPVCSLMDRVTLADTVGAECGLAGEGIRLLASSVDGVPSRENLAWRAASALRDEVVGRGGEPFDADLSLSKKIPVAAGLGGGSSDAAAVLKLLPFLLKLDIPGQTLAELAAGLGADVPFFLTSGPQLAEGRGERLSPVSLGFDYAVVLVNPGVPLSTAEVYRAFDKSGAAAGADFATQAARLKAAAAGGLASLDDLIGLMRNDLAAPARALCPQIAEIERDLTEAGARMVLVSGSGPSVFGIFPDKKAAETAHAALKHTPSAIWVLSPIPDRPSPSTPTA